MRSRPFLFFVLTSSLVGCTKEPPPKPAPTTPPASVSEVKNDPPPPTAPAPAEKKMDPMSTWRDGMTITTRGKVSTIIWQHMMTTVPGKKHAYFDVDGEKMQTVVYWKDPPTCSGLIEVTGKVIELRGPSKKQLKQGEKETKVDDSYSELQLDIESARCVEG